jgi:predicted transcriptional regulator
MIVRDIVLAIKPKYTKKIYLGEKQFELRRKLPHNMINHVYLYETRPVKKITGYLTLKQVVSGSPDKVW